MEKVIYINTQIVIKLSARLKIEKYFTQMKSTTFSLNILQIPFQIAQDRINQKEISNKSFLLICFLSVL